MVAIPKLSDSNASSIPWVEKYRPKSITDISSQQDVVSVLKNSLNSSNLPHMLFYGPPGTGKTSTILALAKDLFGPQLYRNRILELNASDERGINVIREKVKNFAKTTVKETVPGFPCPPFKLIILDEADSLTTDAQTALRRVMELYSKGTRFCIICNYVSKIIEPLTSRCAKFRFSPVEVSAGLTKLKFISNEENIQLSEGDETLNKLLEISRGDLRRAITLLQTAHRLGRTISINLLLDLGGIIPDQVINSSYSLLIDQNTSPISLIEFSKNSIINQGFSALQFIHQLSKLLVNDPSITAIRKAMFSLRLSQIDHNVTDGADEYIQLSNFLLYSHNVLNTTSPLVPAFTNI